MGAKQQRDAKEELVDFLDKKCFEPVLQASPDKYGEADRRKLEDVQRSTESSGSGTEFITGALRKCACGTSTT